MPPANAPTIFTDAEIEKMRLFVTEHDKRASVNVFDLNNPPRTNYVHQEFPRIVYKLDPEGHQINKKVHDAEEHKAALADGWSNVPVAAPVPEEIAVDPAAAKDAEAIDTAIAAARRRKNGK